MLGNKQFYSEEWYKLYRLGYSKNKHLSDLTLSLSDSMCFIKQDSPISLYEQEQISCYTISHMVYLTDLFETLV